MSDHYCNLKVWNHSYYACICTLFSEEHFQQDIKMANGNQAPNAEQALPNDTTTYLRFVSYYNVILHAGLDVVYDEFQS
jgi:hypothetical protein